MPSRSRTFIRSHFTNSDRKPAHQLAIHERGEWIMARLQRCAFRVQEFEPLVLSLCYLFCDAFRSTGKNRHEFVYLCREALLAAKSSRRRPIEDAEEWIKHTLDSLVRKRLLRRSGNRLVTTTAGEAKIAAIESARSARDPEAQRLVLVTAKPARSRRGVEPRWFAEALVHLKDNLPQYEIAKRLGIAESTLSANPHWRAVKKRLAIPTRRGMIRGY